MLKPKANPEWQQKNGISSALQSIYFERMEPKILLSADALSGLIAVDPFNDNDVGNSSLDINQSIELLNLEYQSNTPNPQILDLDALSSAFGNNVVINDNDSSIEVLGSLLDATNNADESRLEILFIDAATPDYQTLLEGVDTDNPDTNYQIFILQSHQDGITQISETLSHFQKVDAIHLISHGNQQGVQLGNTWLTESSLDSYQQTISAWSDALQDEADFLIYGCNIAASESGLQLISDLAEFTGADVAASDDLTGSADLGGDWDLEHTVGELETQVVITASTQAQWTGLLASSTLNPTQDTYLDSANQDTTFGTSNDLLVNKNGGGFGNQHSLLQFDLSTIPAGSVITNATLNLNATAISDPFDVHIYEVTTAWAESSVTWNTTPVIDTTAAASITATTTGTHSWDITSLVQDWSDGTKTNNGFVVGSRDSEDDTITYDSSDDAAGTKPELVITYLPMVDAIDDSYTTAANALLTVAADGVLANDIANTTINTSTVTPGATLEWTAWEDTDGDNKWQDTTGLNGYNADFSGATVVRDTALANAPAGITAAYVFDGTGGGEFTKTFEDLAGDPTNNDASFELWFRPSDASGTEILMDVGNTGDDGFSLRLKGDKLEFYVWKNAESDWIGVTHDLAAEIASGKFIHMVASIDTGTGTVSLRINGGAAATNTNSSINDWASSSDKTGIGDVGGALTHTLSSPTANPFIGEIASVRLYESVLTDAEVQNNFDAMNLSVQSNTNSVAGATVNVNADGSFTYDPGALFNTLLAGDSTDDTFSYTTIDADGNTDTATVTVTVTGVNQAPTFPVFINEIHYNDNNDIAGDENEGIEIMGHAGTDLTGWSLELYNGFNGTLYGGPPIDLTGSIIPDQDNGYGTVVFLIDPIQNGTSAPDGIALVNANSDVVQFISYGSGVFTTPTEGTAVGMTPVNIGVHEDGNAPAGLSLQLTGNGSNVTWVPETATSYGSNMTWQPESTNSFGSLNDGQSGYLLDSIAEDIAETTGKEYTHAEMLALLGARDFDDADSALSIEFISTSIVNGTITMSGGTGGSGTTFTVQSDPDFNGLMTFDYQVSDDQGATSSIASGAINITAVNDDPAGSVTMNNAMDDNDGASTLFSASSISDVDVGENDLTLRITLSNTAAGTISGGGFTETFAGSGIYENNTGLSVADANTQLALVQFTPTNNTASSGTLATNVSVTVNDQGAGGDISVLTPSALTVTLINDNPAGSVTLNNAMDDNDGASTLFSASSISDVDVGENDLTLRITLSNTAAGTISGGGFTETFAGSGIYENNTGLSVADANTQLALVQFTPTNNTASSGTLATNVSVTVNDQGAGGDISVLTPSALTVTLINDNPAGSVTLNNAMDDNDGASTLFSATAVSDADVGENDLTLRITLSNTAAGTISGGGFVETFAGSGIYENNTGLSVADANTQLALVQFTPTNNTASSGTLATNVSVTVNDQGAGGDISVLTPSALTVTLINDNPAGSVTLNNAMDDNDGASTLFSASSISDVDVGENDLTLRITLSNTAAGTISGGGFTETFAGSGIYENNTGLSVADANTQLALVQFTPTNNTASSGTLATNVSVTVNDQGAGGDISVLTPSALTVTLINDNPAGSVTLNNAMDDNDGASTLFSASSISDVDVGENDLTLRITLSNTAAGTISGGGFTETFAGSGIYENNTGLSVADANTQLALVQFTPINNTASSGTLATNVSVTVNDQGAGGDISVLTPSALTVTLINDNPAGSVTLNNAMDDNDGASTLFSATAVSDADVGENDLTLRITLSNTAAGTISGGGFVETFAGSGIYENNTGLSVADANTQLALVQFTPTNNTASSGTLATNVSVTVNDQDSGDISVLTATPLTVTLVNDNPAGSVTLNAAMNDNAGASTLFSASSISDVDVGENDLTLRITLSNTAAGTISGGGFTETFAGSGIYVNNAGLSVADANAQLALVQFTPTNNTASSGTLATNVSVTVDDQDSGEITVLTATPLTVTIINDNPGGSITLNAAMNDNAGASTLFSASSISDADVGENDLTLRITLSNTAAGSISGGGFTETFAGSGIYENNTGLSVADANAQLALVQFTPTNNTASSGTLVTNVSVTVDDQGAGGDISVLAASPLTVTIVNDNPSGSGNLTSVNLNDNLTAGSANIFSGLSVSDVDSGEADLTLRITISDPAAASIFAGGFTDLGLGVYEKTGLTVTQANSLLDVVKIKPTNNTGDSGSFTTDVSVSVDDQGGSGFQDVLPATTITITRVNDAAIVSSDNVVLAETDVALTSSGTLTSTDIDNVDNSFTANSIVGTIGNFSIDAAGVWTFTANSAFDNLNATDSLTETYNVTSVDGTASTVKITINGTNDTAMVSSDVIALTEIDAVLTSSGTLTSTDADNTDNIFTANTVVGTIGSFSIDAAGDWNFTANSTFDNLSASDSVNETYNVTSVDGTTSTVKIVINGSNDASTGVNITSSVGYDAGDSAVALNDIVISDVDNAEIVTATLTLANVSTGTLSSNDGATYNAATGLWSITGTVSDVNLALANLSFIPAAGNVLDSTVAVSIDDGDEDSSGPLIGALNITIDSALVAEEAISKTTTDTTEETSAPEETVTETEAETETEVAVIKEEVVIEAINNEKEDNEKLFTEETAETETSVLDVLYEEEAAANADDVKADTKSNESEVDEEAVIKKQEGHAAVMMKMRDQFAALNDPFQLIGTENYVMRLNEMREELVMEQENTEKVVGGSLTVSAGFSVGYVVWLARSGIIMSSVLSSMPAWRFIDPLPVLASLSTGAMEDEESLEDMVGKANENQSDEDINK